MALIVNKKLKNGIMVDSAYARVEYISSNKNILGIQVKFYTSIENEALETINYQTDLKIDDSNYFKQAYEYLKTLEEFKDAEDV